MFILLGFTASSLGRLFLSNQDWFVIGAGVMVMIFGAHFLGVIRIGILDSEARMSGGDRGGSAFGAYVLGLAFAFGWTPCIGPILGSVLSVAASSDSVYFGIWLLLTYSAGLGVPFLLAAAGIGYFLKFLVRIRSYIRPIEIFTGLLLILFGVLILTNRMQEIAFFFIEYFPILNELG